MKIKQKLRHTFLSRKNGYTLVEVIVASALLAVLMIGITMFIGPVLSNVASNETSARANNVAESVQYYISRNLRNASFVAIFSDAQMSDFTSQANINDTTSPLNEVLAKAVTGSMPDYVSKQLSKTGDPLYDVKCMSIRSVTDAKSGETKYLLYDEYFSSGADTLDSSKSSLVFEQCFYEGLFMRCSFAHVEAAAATPDPGTADPGTAEPSPSPSPAPVTPTYRPAIEIRLDVYDKAAMGATDLLFSGKGYTELINVKNAEENKTLNLPYKVFHKPDEAFPTSLGTGKDIFIFYVVRKVI